MKKAISITLLMLLLLTFPACQPTPEKDVIIGEVQTPEVEDTPEEALSDILAAYPESYSKAIDDFGPNCKLVFDADVIIPNVDRIKTFRVKRRVFPDEQLLDIIDELTGGQELYAFEPYTKEYIEGYMLRYQQNCSSTSWYTDEEINQELARWRGKWSNAPSMDERQPLDLNNLTEHTLCIADFQNGDTRSALYFGVGNNEFYYSKQPLCILQEEYSVVRGGQIVWEPVGTVIEVNITKEEAQPLADEWVKRLVGDSFMLSDVQRGRIADSSGTIFGSGWLFTYNRYEFMPVYILPGAYKMPAGSAAPTMIAPWDMERIEILIDKDGILALAWNGACDFDSIIDETASVLSYDEFEAIMMNMLTYKHCNEGNQAHPCTINVHTIALGSALLAIPDMLDEYGQYVPVWYVLYDVSFDNYGDDAIARNYAGSLVFKADDGRYVEPRMTLAAAMAGS